MEKLSFYNRNDKKYVKTHDKYKCVSIYRNTKNQSLFYMATITINFVKKCKNFLSDVEAAKWVDMKRIESGLEPINILKRKC